MKQRRKPEAPEIEASVLGAMMIDSEAVPKAIELLTAGSFSDNKHQIIFRSMVRLFNEGEPVDTVTMYDEIKKREQLEDIGGALYLSQLSQNISSAANIEYHAKILLEKEILRQLIDNSIEIAESAYEGKQDAFDILDTAEQKIFDITETHLKKSFTGMDKAVKDALDYIETIHSKKDKKFAVPTGFYELDNILGGLQKTDFIILAARPSIGKTAFALTLARNAAIDFNIPVGVFSLEMSTLQLTMRMICAEARVSAQLVRTGKLPKEDGSRLMHGAAKISQAEIFVDDTPAQTVLEIRAKARRLKTEHNIGMIIIDYIQLMRSAHRGENREREVSHISSSLKALAKELNIPIIALAQLNRAVEMRNDKKPQLSDLRESGSLEQDSDVVLFLHRPEFYGITYDAEGNNLEGVAEVIIGKHRNGGTGEVQLAYMKEYTRFENLAHYDVNPYEIDREYAQTEDVI